MAEDQHVRAFSAEFAGFEFREADNGDGLTIAGYITRFGEPTQISDWLGDYTEEIKRGAFANTIAARGPGKVKMQFNHGHDMAFGALPIGVWTDLREDRKGLWGEGRIHDTWHTIPIRAAIESGALDGMSFKFKVVQESWRRAKTATEMDHRTITEVNLFEAGVVVHPAYEGTSVGLRSQALDLWRRTLSPAHDDAHGDRPDTVRSESAAVAGDGTDPQGSEADTAGGVTRRELRRMALHALRYTDEQASGDAA